MDLEQLRQRVITGCERIMGLRIGVSAAERRMAAAQRTYWAAAGAEQLQLLASALAVENEEDYR